MQLIKKLFLSLFFLATFLPGAFAETIINSDDPVPTNTSEKALTSVKYVQDYVGKIVAGLGAAVADPTTAQVVANQVDWNESDNSSPNFIKNKPVIPGLPGVATNAAVGLVKPDGTTITVDANGTLSAVDSGTGDYVLQPATTTTMGGVIVGDGLAVDANGTISATAQDTPIATAETAGSVKPDGTTITVDANGVITATANAELGNYVHKVNDKASAIDGTAENAGKYVSSDQVYQAMSAISAILDTINGEQP
jgi:hypothetical protein